MKKKRIVVKIGTAVLTRPSGILDKEVIKNSLVLILSLYDDVDEPYPTLGTDIGDITDESEKEDFLNLLKEEFM